MRKINIESPHEIIENMRSISVRYKVSILSSIVAFIITHMFFFGGRFANEDYLHYTMYKGNHIGSGRWLSGIGLHYMAPWVMGLIAFILLTSTVLLIISLFDIQNKLSIIMTSFIIITFPSFSYGFAYLFMVQVYTISLICAVLSVWLSKKYDKGWIFGAIVLMISLGYYQSYVAVAMTLCVIDIIFSTLTQRYNLEQLKKIIMRYMLMGICGMILYFIGLKISLFVTNMTLLDYRGINEIGRIPLAQLPELLMRTYRNFILFFLGDSFFYTNTFIKLIYMLIGLFTGYVLFKRIMQQDITHKLLVVAGIVVLPICVNIIDIIAPQSSSGTLTIFACCLVFLIPILLTDGIGEAIFMCKSKIKWIITCGIIVVIANNYYLTNIYYLKVSTYYEQTALFYNRLYTRLEQTEGFKPNMKIAVFGDAMSTKLLMGNVPEKFEPIINEQGLRQRFIGMNEASGNNHHTSFKAAAFISNIVGVRMYPAKSDELNLVEQTEEYINMGTYPDKSSIQIIDDIIVVNMKPQIKSYQEVGANNTIQFSVNVDEKYNAERIAWYIYKDGSRIMTTGYMDEYEYEYEYEGPGTYNALCFIKDNQGNLITTIQTQSIDVK